MARQATLEAVIAAGKGDYRRLGIRPGTVEAWEDGARTDNRRGTYEWWYFDAHLDDGAKLVVVFMNKDLAAPQKPLEPLQDDCAGGGVMNSVHSFKDPRSRSVARWTKVWSTL